MKYNYVILSTDWDVYRQLYADVIGRDDVIYVAGPQASKRGLRKILYRINFNKALNRIIPLPFKGLWNSSYFMDSFKEKKPVCFVLFRDWMSLEPYTGYVDWLKQRYPGSKFVWFLHDLMAGHVDFYTNQVLDIDQYKRKLDLVVTCNPAEAQRYCLIYHKVPISKLSGLRPVGRYDVLFIGQDKGRLDRLFRIYDALTQKGARCRFFISGASRQDVAGRDGITLLDRPMPYQECQAWVVGANCLLELRYDPDAGETLRSSEALIYGKKLITDNQALTNSPDFDLHSIRVLDSDDAVEQIDPSFLTSALDVPSEKTDFYGRRLSPVAFLEDIEALL